MSPIFIGYRVDHVRHIYTRLDVSYVISMMIRYQSNSGKSHWTAVKSILKYLKRTKDMSVIYGNKEELTVKGYEDASFQTDKDNFKSQFGFVFMLKGGLVNWTTSKQETIVDSTIDSEYIATNEAAKEAMWL